jgi:hypothetical protein
MPSSRPEKKRPEPPSAETREAEPAKPPHERPHPHYDPPPRYDFARPVELTPNTGALTINAGDPVRVIEGNVVQVA